MDAQNVTQALLASIGSDNNLRNQAYNYFESIKHSEGFVRILMQLVIQDPYSQLAQISAIYIKNLVRNWESDHWRAEEKQLIRQSLIHFMRASVPDKVRLQFEELASFIYKIEVPDEDFYISLKNALQTEETLYAGLCLLKQVCKEYEYATTVNKRSVLVNLSHHFMPLLIEILEKLLENPTDQGFQYAQVILTTYWASFYFEVPPVLYAEESLKRWMNCFHGIMVGQLLESSNNSTEPETMPQWICKKWSAQIVFRFFSRYFIKLYLKEHNLFICEYFQNNWATQFFKVIANAVFNQKTQFLTDSVLNFYIKYITQSVKFEPLLKEFKPELAGRILIYVCLPLLAIKESDQEIWTDNPVEFIRKNEDEIKAYYSKKTSAISLILILCEKGYLIPFFNYLNAELLKNPDWVRKDSLFLVLGSISDLVKASERITPDVQTLLESLILQEYLNDNNFFKYRCAWVFSKYAQMQFTSTSIQESILKRTCQLMVDPELPVRYSACLALSRFLNWDVSKAQLSGEIKNLLTIYLKLIDEINSEEVIESLESIISVFPNEMIPFACELAQILVVNFEKYMQESKEESSMPAYSTLNTLAKVVEVVQSDTETLYKLSVIMKDSLHKMVLMRDFTEECCSIIVGLLYFTPNGTMVHLYRLFEILWVGVLGNDVGGESPVLDSGNAEDMFPCFANFITKFPEKTVENMNGLVYNACKLLHVDEEFLFLGCQVLLVLLENFKIDQLKALVPEIISQISKVFVQSLSKKYKIACCQVIFTCIWNSPEVAVQLYQVIRPILEFSCSNLRFFSEYLSKIHMVLGIGSLFTFTPPAQVLIPDLNKYFKVLFLCAADGKVEDIEDEEVKEIHKVDLTLNYNTTDDGSEDEEYEDYPFGIEPVNNFTFNFESQDPTDAYVSFISFLRSKPDYSPLFDTLTLNENKILSFIIK